jgi:hypothetical protein
MRSQPKLFACGLLTLLATVGCQKMSFDDMMKQPPRPAELDQLAVFIGSWEGTAEGRMMGSDEVIKSTGHSEYTWDADKWVLVERSEYKMGNTCRMNGVGLWSWDAGAKKFRTAWTDNYGSHGDGTVWLDGKTKVWHMRSKTSYTDGTSHGEGTLRQIDNNTFEWNFAEYDALHLLKFMEMHGTFHRK